MWRKVTVDDRHPTFAVAVHMNVHEGSQRECGQKHECDGNRDDSTHFLSIARRLLIFKCEFQDVSVSVVHLKPQWTD